MGKVWITFLMIILFCVFVVFSILDKSNKEEKKIRTLLSFGVFLIITSSVIFLVSSWNSLTSNFKVLFLTIESVIFVLFGTLLKYVFKINNTGTSLNVVGILLLNITYIYTGYINTFNYEFNLLGKYKYLYILLALIVDLIIVLLNKIINKKRGYSLSLLLIIPMPFLITMQVINDAVFALAVSALFMLILNLTKNWLFKKTLPFNIINIFALLVLSIAYFISLIYQVEFLDKILFGRITLIIYTILLIANAFVYMYKSKSDAAALMPPLYAIIVVNLFGIFSMNTLTASLAVYILSIILYGVSLLSKRQLTKITTTVYSYIFGIEGIVIMYFDSKYVVLSIVLSAVFLLISLISECAKKENKLIDGIARRIFTVLFIISIIIQPQIIDKVKLIDVLMIFNLYMFISYIVLAITNKKLRVLYLSLLGMGILITLMAISSYGIIYTVITALILLILYLYYYYKKIKPLKIITYLLLIAALLLGLHNYLFITSIVLIIVSVILFMISKEALYLIMSYVPICVLLYNLPITYTRDINTLIYIVVVYLSLLPITATLKGIIKAPKIVVEIITSVLLVSMFLSFISIINIYVALVLGIVSVIVLLIGYINNYKSFIYEGYIFMFLTIVIQTSSLLKELPWWIYILFVGILLLMVALIKEIKRSE